MTALVTQTHLYRLLCDLSERDWQLIETLSKLRVATSRQLKVLHFADVSRQRAEQRLAVMVGHRVLSRLPRVVGGAQAGSRGHVYALDVAGLRLINLNRVRRPRPPRPVGVPYLNHALALTQVYVDLVLAERVEQLRIVRFDGEPDCWRSYIGRYGSRMYLNPDGFTVVSSDGWEYFWFFEVDMDTESTPTLARKLDAYRNYWLSGHEEPGRPGIFPRVLWVVQNETRAEMLRQVIHKHPVESADLFYVVLATEVATRVRQEAQS